MSKKRRPIGVKDLSPNIEQREKLAFDLEIKPFNWTEKQKKFIEIGLSKETKIIICKSPPGTGKTLCSVFCALTRLNNKKSGALYYIRNPIESASKGLGFIPGTISEKMDWVIQPLIDQLSQLLTPNKIKSLLEDKRIEGIPVGYLKGRTFNVSTLICDEAEDMNLQELLLTFCRLGKFSTLFLIGDEKQSNIKNSGFNKVFDAFNNDESKKNGIHTFEFCIDDCMRNETIKYITKVFDGIN